MVVQGNFSVRLVNAETKQAFKEHKCPKGNIYAEVEPGVDYFIEIGVVGDGPYCTNTTYVFKFVVDDQELSYQYNMGRSDAKSLQGIWSYRDGTQKMKALSFRAPPKQDDDNKENNGGKVITARDLTGKVEVKVYEGIFDCTKPRVDYLAEALSQTTLSDEVTDLEASKILRTEAGTIEDTQTVSKTLNSYNKGALLATIPIHYCTAAGLIRVKVLQAPAKGSWEELRIYKPFKPAEHVHTVNVDPEIIKTERKTACGEVIGPATEQELFDLTQGSDSEDDDN